MVGAARVRSLLDRVAVELAALRRLAQMNDDQLRADASVCPGPSTGSRSPSRHASTPQST
jgi:hypothetical protein